VEADLAAMAPGTVQLSIFSWNSRLARYVKAGQYENAMRLFQQMKQEGLSPDKFTFVQVLNACANLPALEGGRSIHMQIIQSGCDSDIYVCNSLIDMYAKCGSLEDACSVFNTMRSHDVVTWNSLILGHVRCGQGLKALLLFQQMQQEGMEPDPVTFVGVVNACASIAALEDGKGVHKQIIQSSFESIIFLGNSLVDMYAKCGSIEDDLRILTGCPHAMWLLGVPSFWDM
jgi:pentatricopeptide repeat protein